MNLRKTVRKIAALGLGVSMVGATLLGAMATADLANFPSMFINADGKFDGIFVVGKNAKAEDIIGQNMLVSALQAVAVKKTPIAGAAATTAVSEGYEMGNNDWYFNQSAADIDDQLTSAELPDLLATITYNDNEGNNKGTVDYKQKLVFPAGNFTTGTFSLQFDQDDDVAAEAKPYIFFKDSTTYPIYYYNLTFDTAVEVDNSSSASLSADLEGTSMTILGKTFNIVDAKASGGYIDELKFLGGEQVSWMSQGEKLTVDVDGTTHTVEMIDVTETASSGEITACGFLVDGQSVWVDKGTTETASGVVLGVTDGKAIHSSTQDTDVCKVSLGAHSVTLRKDKETKINDDKIKDVTDFYAQAGIRENQDADTTFELAEISYKVNPNSAKLYLAEGDELVDPVFGGFKIVFADLVEDDFETISITTSSKSGKLEFQNKDGRDVTLDFKSPGTSADPSAYWSTSTASGTDVEDNMYLMGGNCTGVTALSDCKGAKFLVSSGSNYETHVVQISNINLVDNQISFEDLTYGTETNDLAYSENEITTSFSIAGISDTLKLGINETNKLINFTYLGQGYTVQSDAVNGAPWDKANSTRSVLLQTKNKGYIQIVRTVPGNMSTSAQPSFANSSLKIGTIVFSEYADSGTLLNTAGNEKFADEYNSTSESFWVNATYDAASDNALELLYNAQFLGNFTFGWKNLNADDDDNKKTITYKGTIITIDDDNSKQSIVIEHPKVASYARVFVAPVAASTTVSAEGTYTSEIQQIGVNQFKLDTEVADATAVNVVAVGGPCANSVVAALMGNPAECYSAMGIEAGQGLIKLFEDATTGKVALVVAGQTAEDTRLSSQVVANYAEYDLSGDELIAVTVNAADLKVITREEAAATAAEAEEAAAPVEEAEEPAAEEATE